jgi:hypothetical protein
VPQNQRYLFFELWSHALLLINVQNDVHASESSISPDLQVLVGVDQLRYVQADFFEGLSDRALHPALASVDLAARERLVAALPVLDQHRFGHVFVQHDGALHWHLRILRLIFVLLVVNVIEKLFVVVAHSMRDYLCQILHFDAMTGFEVFGSVPDVALLGLDVLLARVLDALVLPSLG